MRKFFWVIFLSVSFWVKGQEVVKYISDGGLITENNGTLLDSRKEKYEANKEYSVEIYVKNSEYIFFYFEDLDLDPTNDYVDFVKDGYSISKIYGNNFNSPVSVKVPGERVKIYFKTDENDERRGFQLAWQSFLPQTSGNFNFDHHLVEKFDDIEDGRFGPLLLADFDWDSDGNRTLDIVLGVSNAGSQNGLYLYENTGGMSWAQRRLIGTGFSGQQLSGKAVNIDNDADGLVDIVTANTWYKNLGGTFQEVVYDNNPLSLYHDVTVANLYGDANDENFEIIQLYNSGQQENPNHFRWFRHENGIENLWTVTDFNMLEYAGHGSLDPAGIGDLNNDGNPDFIMRNHILLLVDKEKLNDPNPEERKNAWNVVDITDNFGKNNHYKYVNWGAGSMAYIAHMNNDPYPDIVITDSDMLYSQLAILFNNDGTGTSWTTKYLLRTSNYGSLHSLQVADFDKDGDQDILVVDQEDMKNLKQKNGPLENSAFYIWENVGSNNWIERKIWNENFGGHQAQIGDIDNDGDLDIVSKVWVGEIGTYDGLHNGIGHLDVFENKLNIPVVPITDEADIFPNPFTNMLTINKAENVTRVEFINLLGSVVFIETFDDNGEIVEIDASQIGSGHYTLRITDYFNNVKYEKLIKE